MAELIEIGEQQERVILFAASTNASDDTEESVEELRELVKTAGAETVGAVIQNRENIHPGTYLGKGKIQELKEMVWETGATGVVCDDELSPAQLKNLEDALDTKVMDRTMIILDIFAKHATTREGKLQVELAQLKYRSNRLIGMGQVMSRLGGGIGTRGPGEKKLEVDRRLIRERISKLSADLKDDIAHREVMRKQRLNSHIPIVSIVGYTNAGKSTLLNHMTQAGVLEEDKLFATLDPTSRNYKLPNGQEIILTDTVGFIRKLPHHLIDAFRSTLEEAKFADIILHVVDISNPQADLHILTVYDTLRELGVKDKPVVTLFNKIDKVDELPAVKDFQADHTLYISAKQETGFEKITDILAEIINQSRIYIEQTIPYAKAGVIQQIRKSGNLLEEEYREDGIFVRAYVDAGTKGLL